MQTAPIPKRGPVGPDWEDEEVGAVRIGAPMGRGMRTGKTRESARPEIAGHAAGRFGEGLRQGRMSNR